MKKLIYPVAILLFLIIPLHAQTEEMEAKTPVRSADKVNIEELHKISELPEAIKDARDAGTEEEEIQRIVKGVEEKKLTADEGVGTIRILRENTDQGRSNHGISDFVLQQKASGITGKELGQSVKLELQQRHRIKKEEKKKEQKTEKKEIKKIEDDAELEKEKIKKQEGKETGKKTTADGDVAPKAVDEKENKKTKKEKAADNEHKPARENKTTK